MCCISGIKRQAMPIDALDTEISGVYPPNATEKRYMWKRYAACSMLSCKCEKRLSSGLADPKWTDIILQDRTL